MITDTGGLITDTAVMITGTRVMITGTGTMITDTTAGDAGIPEACAYGHIVWDLMKNGCLSALNV